MSKIICEICGTTYPDTSEQCPICGCSRDAAADLLSEENLIEEFGEDGKSKGGKFTSRKKKEIFDFDEANGDVDKVEAKEERNPYEEEEEYEEAPKSSVFTIIVLTVLIVALLAGAGFLFVRYVMPNLGWGEKADETQAMAETTQAPEETMAPEIPCQDLIMTSGKTAELSAEGQYFMLHVIASPADTTDKILYESSDESVVTVTEDGRLTAVSEGEATIYITCGDFQLTCNVVCKFVEETLPPVTEAPVVTEAQETAGETKVEETPDETKPQETAEATKPASTDGVTLKLKKKDISLGVYYQFTLELDCDLKPEDVQWKSEHPHIASVDDKGVVTAKKSGTTAVIAKYGDQEVQCIVRCSK